MTTKKICWLALALALEWPAGCKRKDSSAAVTPEAIQTTNPLEITADEDLLGRLKIGEPTAKVVRQTLRVAGRVEADETRIARVSAPLTGRVIHLEVAEGQSVKRGQELAQIRSTELADSQFEYLKAYSQQQLTARAVTRAKQLMDAGVIGEAELQRREAEAAQAAFEVAALRDQLRVLGMSEESVVRLERTRSINSVIPILATIDGTIMERRLTIGQMAQAAETIFVLADLSTVWLVADVPEQAAGNVQTGKAVECEIAALPGHVLEGRLSFVSSIVSPETRTVRVRMNVRNPEGRYKPAMLATMTLADDAARERVIPSSAIVRENNLDHVFVQTSRTTFLLRRVTIGEEFGQDRVLQEGLRPGEKIVLDGAFHLNNERRRRSLKAS